jgi:hypothetical protein
VRVRGSFYSCRSATTGEKPGQYLAAQAAAAYTYDYDSASQPPHKQLSWFRKTVNRILGRDADR